MCWRLWGLKKMVKVTIKGMYKDGHGRRTFEIIKTRAGLVFDEGGIILTINSLSVSKKLSKVFNIEVPKGD